MPGDRDPDDMRARLVDGRKQPLKHELSLHQCEVGANAVSPPEGICLSLPAGTRIARHGGGGITAASRTS